MTPEIPAPTTPLTQATSDMSVIEGKQDKPQLLWETEEARFFKTLIDNYEKQEEFVRQDILRDCRKNLNYWNDFQYLAWDEVASDWKTAQQIMDEDPTADIDPALYAKVVNVYKAHGEILIGALTAGVPTVRFPPSDPDDHEDVQTSKAYTKIAEVVQKHNRAKLLLMKSLWILYNQHFVACYNENKKDYRFGSVKEPQYADVTYTQRNHFCPACGLDLGSDVFPGAVDSGAGDAEAPGDSAPEGPEVPAEEGSDPQAPVGTMGINDNVPDPDNPVPPVGQQPPVNARPALPNQTCPSCGASVSPDYEDQQFTQNEQVGEVHTPKNRECLEVFGPVNVKVPAWVKEQSSTPYLDLETDEAVGLLREIYPELADKIQGNASPATYEAELRIATTYRNDFPRELVTVQRVWLRTWAFNAHTDIEQAKLLKKKYPDGVYVVILNHDIVAEIVEDKLDEHWTISESPTAETVHARPMGSTMIPLQDIENEVTNLTLETIEFGLPEVFADPFVLDFEAYQRQEARPGQVSPATAPSGKSLGEGFYEIKAATLSREVAGFAERNTKMQQFVFGSYPSVYGGQAQGGSGTAREYELSRTSALQRLSTTWFILQEWWAKVLGKAVKSYADHMRQDEKFVQQKGSNFVSVWIRQAELSGDVGEVYAEMSEAFPVSWSQKRDVIMNLMQMKDENVTAVITHPENASLVAAIIGVPEMYIPGEDDRNKQLIEIAELILAEPEMMMGPTGPMMKSSVPITPDLDNHKVEAEICKAWLKSEVGLDAIKTNPGGRANVYAHLKEHLEADAQEQMKQAMMMAGPEGMDDKGLDKGAKPQES